MSLLFTDSFDGVIAGAAKWDAFHGNNVIELAAGRNGTKGLRSQSGTQAMTVASKGFAAGSNRVFAGAWAWRNDNDFSDNNALIGLRSDTGSFVEVRMGGSNQLVLEGTGLPGGGAGVVVGPQGLGQLMQWVFVELMWEPGVALELRANTETIYSTSPSDGGGMPITLYMTLAGNSQRFWEDIYLVDTATPAPNDFLGPVKIQNLTPDGAGFRTELAPSDVGGNWEMVNDGDDATYVEGDVGAGDLYAFDDLPGSEPVLGVVQYWRAFDSEGGAITGRPIVRTGATEYDGDAAVLGGSAVTRVQEWGVNPDTGLAWTPAEVNAAEFGAEFF